MCISVWNVRWKLSSNFAKQIKKLVAGWLSTRLQNPRWDWGLKSAPPTFYSSKSLSINSVFRRPSNQHTEAQCPGQPTSPFTPRDAECPWEGHNRSIIQWSSTFYALNKAVLCSPIEVDGCWASTGKCTVTLWECIMKRKSSQSTCDKQLILNELVFKMDVL